MSVDTAPQVDPAGLLLRMAGGTLRPDDLQALSQAAGAVLTGRAPGLDDALRLAGGQGRRKAATVAAQDRRDALIRQLAAALAPGAPVAQQALAVRSKVQRYGAAGWPREADADTCPHPAGSERALLWELHRTAAGRVPCSISRLQEILGENPTNGGHSSDAAGFRVD